MQFVWIGEPITSQKTSSSGSSAFRIINNPITIVDINRSRIIYGPPIPPLKGRTSDQESARVKDLTMVQLPSVDFHYVKEITAFHTISRKINYRTASFPLSRSKANILNELKAIYKVYNVRGFKNHRYSRRWWVPKDTKWSPSSTTTSLRDRWPCPRDWTIDDPIMFIKILRHVCRNDRKNSDIFMQYVSAQKNFYNNKQLGNMTTGDTVERSKTQCEVAEAQWFGEQKQVR